MCLCLEEKVVNRIMVFNSRMIGFVISNLRLITNKGTTDFTKNQKFITILNIYCVTKLSVFDAISFEIGHC